MSLDILLNRIRAEYREVPGLRLTKAEACRFWQLDPAMCEAVLSQLLQEQFLILKSDGRFCEARSTGPIAGSGLSAALERTG